MKTCLTGCGRLIEDYENVCSECKREHEFRNQNELMYWEEE